METPFRRNGSFLASAAFFTLTLWGLSESRSFFIPVLFAGLIAFTLAPITRWMKKRGASEGVAVAVSTLALILPLSLFIYFLAREGQSLFQAFPAIVQAAKAEFLQLSHSTLLSRFNLADKLNVSKLADQGASVAGTGAGFLVAGLKTFLSAGTEVALILLFAIVMLSSRIHLRKSAERMLGGWEFVDSRTVLDDSVTLIQRFLTARITIVGLVSALDLIILFAFKIPYAIVLGALLGVLTLIPAIGFIMGVIPVLIVALAVGHGVGGVVSLFLGLGAVSLIESHLLTPRLVGRSLNLNALATFLGFFAGGLLWGIAGVFLSVPILGIVRIVFSATPKMKAVGQMLSQKDEPIKKAA